MNSSLSRWSPVVLSILRIVIGLLFMEHGTQKLFNFPPFAATSRRRAPGFNVDRCVDGIRRRALFLLGLFTRPVALLLCGEMAVAYFMFHAKGSPYPDPESRRTGGRLLLCFSLLMLRRCGTVEHRRDVEQGRRGKSRLTILIR